jgi:hypothetical protein
VLGDSAGRLVSAGRVTARPILTPVLVRYFCSKLNIDAPVSILIYFTYMLMISLTFFLLTGSIGFFACFWFVRKIYGAIKVD